MKIGRISVIYIHIGRALFLNIIRTNPRNEFSMSMLCSEIVSWKIAFHKYVYNIYMKSSFRNHNPGFKKSIDIANSFFGLALIAFSKRVLHTRTYMNTL